MSIHRDAVRSAQLSYLWKVIVWLVVAGPAAMLLVAFVAGALGDMPSLIGVVAMAAMLGVVGGALAIHRANVRCPACGAWLVPVGINGFAPRTCPRCSADLS